MSHLSIAGWTLNGVAFFAHLIWCDKDPTHEDVVIQVMLIASFLPFFNFSIVVLELFTQKVLNIHHGVKRK